jgi:ribosomal protein L36
MKELIKKREVLSAKVKKGRLYVINKRILDFKHKDNYGKNSRVDIPKIREVL